MKKTIAFLLSLVMALSLLTACSTQKEPNSPNKGGNTSDPSNLKIGPEVPTTADGTKWLPTPLPLLQPNMAAQ